MIGLFAISTSTKALTISPLWCGGCQKTIIHHAAPHSIPTPLDQNDFQRLRLRAVRDRRDGLHDISEEIQVLMNTPGFQHKPVIFVHFTSYPMVVIKPLIFKGSEVQGVYNI